MIKLTSSNSKNDKAKINQSQKYGKSLSDLFPKSIIEKIFSFLSEKQKFSLLKHSKHLLEEYDSKIDDYFISRKYQEKIKNDNNNFEDIFYLILNDIKKEKNNNGQKICLYEIENSFVNYAKYLTEKCNKMIKLSLVNINNMEIWKLEFISKLFQFLNKNIHLKIKLNNLELKIHDIFSFVCKFSKAINILEIDDIFNNSSNLKHLKEEINSYFNWNTINKIIINMNCCDTLIDGYDKKKK